MAREQYQGECENCGQSFHWYPVHNGFNQSFYAYCSGCGSTAILDFWGTPLTHHPAVAKLVGGAIPNEIEGLLEPCSCGSRFCTSARPRCPHCDHELLPRAAGACEAASQPQRTRRDWPLTWNPAQVYCVIINDKVVYNPFKHLNSR